MRNDRLTIKGILPIILGSSMALVLSSCTMYDTFDEDLLHGVVPNGGISGDFKDSRDGQVYKIVSIGTHQWFARNLNYNAGDGQSFCYGDDPANCEKYGRLYKGNSSAFVNYLCPKGTHVSTQQDWETLFKRFKGTSIDSVAVFLKALNGWDDSEDGAYGANDESGLSMLPGGYENDGEFVLAGKFGLWWTSSMPDPDYPYTYTTFQLSYASNDVSQLAHEFKKYALSVRCVVDE